MLRAEAPPCDRPVPGGRRASRRPPSRRRAPACRRRCQQSPRRPPRRPRASVPPAEAEGPRTSRKAPGPSPRQSRPRERAWMWCRRQGTWSCPPGAAFAPMPGRAPEPDSEGTRRRATGASAPHTAMPPIAPDRRSPVEAPSTRPRSPGGGRTRAARRSSRRPPIPGLSARGEARERCSRPQLARRGLREPRKQRCDRSRSRREVLQRTCSSPPQRCVTPAPRPTGSPAAGKGGYRRDLSACPPRARGWRVGPRDAASPPREPRLEACRNGRRPRLDGRWAGAGQGPSRWRRDGGRTAHRRLWR